jgi:N-dimethylarginine dimethylaminohydrolase
MADHGPWTRVCVRHARDVFVDATRVEGQWRALNFTAAPDVARAAAQSDAFIEHLRAAGAPVTVLPSPADLNTLTLDAIYVRDASVMTPGGAVMCRMGKPQRAAEPAALEAAYHALGVPILGRIEPPGQLEGGDVTWLTPRIAAVGHGYRTNAEGIRQLRALLGDQVDALIEVGLPHYRGPGDVFHLMSIISPVDVDLAVVYSPLMPVPFRRQLAELCLTMVEVPDEEFDAMGANVFAAAPRRCVMVDGAPRTRARLEAAGADVFVYDGSDISLMGGGGPTCLTRPM